MLRPENCPRCGSFDVCESCYPTNPTRVSFCRCGWDNIEASVGEYITDAVRRILDLPADKLTDQDATNLAWLRHPSCEAELIKLARKR